jgi:raffinose/stachyose/melibiose transport system permease protein
MSAAVAAAGATPRRRKRLRRGGSPLGIAVLVIVTVFWIAPFVLLIMTAVRTEADFLSNGPFSLPGALTLSSFDKAWETGGFATTYTNSALVTLIKVPLGIAIAAPLAYSVAKLRLRLGGAVLFIVLLGLSIPIFIILVPMFSMLRSANLIDSIWGLVPPYLAVGLPFEVLILQSFFKEFPDDLADAARIDGASEWRIFRSVVLPLSKPALITVVILDAVATWNELLMALIILSSAEHRTVPVGLLNFQGQFTTNYTGLSAGILIAIVPILIVYALLQKWIVGGLAGALKG